MAAVVAFVAAEAALNFLVLLVLNPCAAAGGVVGLPFFPMRFDTRVEAAAAFSLDRVLGMMEGEW